MLYSGAVFAQYGRPAALAAAAAGVPQTGTLLALMRTVGEAQTLLVNLGRDHVERDHPPVIATRLIIVSFRSLLNDLDRLVNFIVAIDGVSGRKLDRNIVKRLPYTERTTSSS